MDVDFKITTWERIRVPKDKEAEVLSLLDSGKITNANELIDVLDDASCEILIETEEQMTPQENGGSSTIEALDNGEYLFHNGIL